MPDHDRSTLSEVQEHGLLEYERIPLFDSATQSLHKHVPAAVAFLERVRHIPATSAARNTLPWLITFASSGVGACASRWVRLNPLQRGTFAISSTRRRLPNSDARTVN